MLAGGEKYYASISQVSGDDEFTSILQVSLSVDRGRGSGIATAPPQQEIMPRQEPEPDSDNVVSKEGGKAKTSGKPRQGITRQDFLLTTPGPVSDSATSDNVQSSRKTRKESSSSQEPEPVPGNAKSQEQDDVRSSGKTRQQGSSHQEHKPVSDKAASQKPGNAQSSGKLRPAISSRKEPEPTSENATSRERVFTFTRRRHQREPRRHKNGIRRLQEEEDLPWALFLLIVPFVVGCASFVLLAVWDASTQFEDQL